VQVVIKDVNIVGHPSLHSEGIVSYLDHSDTPSIPVVDGLLLSNVNLSNMDMGVSCNSGPCEHWWLDRVTIRCRTAGNGNSGSDAFAIERGRQIVVTNSYVTGAEADGIDVKGTDVSAGGLPGCS
jgi:hypothetical protein